MLDRKVYMKCTFHIRNGHLTRPLPSPFHPHTSSYTPTEDETVRKTIMREVKLLRALQHENIVGIRETFKRKGKLFIVFEYMEKNILELLEQYPGGLPAEFVRRSMWQLMKSLRHCHLNGIMHRCGI